MARYCKSTKIDSFLSEMIYTQSVSLLNFGTIFFIKSDYIVTL